MPLNIFFAEEGSISIGGTSYGAEIKDVNVSGGARGMNVIRAFGNQEHADEQPMENVEVAFTTIVRDHDWWRLWMGGSPTSGGSAYEAIPRQRNNLQINLFDLTNVSGAQLQINAYSAFATQGDFTLNTTDHGEQSPNFVCLPKDFEVKFVSDRATNPIT